MTRRAPKAEVATEPSTGMGFGPAPPEPRTPEFDWTAIAKKVMRKPGDWYLVFRQGNYGYYSTILQNKIAALKREHGFEVRSANSKRPTGQPRTCDMWVRYVPEQDQRESESK